MDIKKRYKNPSLFLFLFFSLSRKKKLCLFLFFILVFFFLCSIHFAIFSRAICENVLLLSQPACYGELLFPISIKPCYIPRFFLANRCVHQEKKILNYPPFFYKHKSVHTYLHKNAPYISDTDTTQLYRIT